MFYWKGTEENCLKSMHRFKTEIIMADKNLKYIPTAEINLEEAVAKAIAERPEIMTAKNNLELQKIKTHSYTAYYT